MLSVPSGEYWRLDSKCLNDEKYQAFIRANPGKDPFFSNSKEAKKLTRDFCSSCPVLFECRSYGLNHPEIDGVFGGLSPLERRRESKHLQRIAAFLS